MKRRGFVQTAIGLGAFSIGQGSLASLLSDQNEIHFVIDVRLTDIDLLSQCRSNDCAVVHRFAGDIVPLWQNSLLKIWDTGISPIIGRTRYSEYFVLGELARDSGYFMAEKTEQDGEITWMMVPKHHGVEKKEIRNEKSNDRHSGVEFAKLSGPRLEVTEPGGHG